MDIKRMLGEVEQEIAKLQRVADNCAVQSRAKLNQAPQQAQATE
jgi:hypothetical protein